MSKGVAIAHGNLNNLIAWHREAFGLESGWRSSSVAGLAVDAAGWEMWPALCAGVMLTLSSSAEARDVERLLAWWGKQNVDVGYLPTEVAEHAFRQNLGTPGLRSLLVGGDRLRRLPEEPWPYELINNYGSAEVTVVVTSGAVQGRGTEVAIGRPIANTRIYILDGRQEAVPVGVAGELHIGGAGVARGYLGRPEWTAERFVADPYVEEEGARMYRTGDVGRWQADGTIEFLGRRDDQVKIRGYRIELGEIEARLMEHGGVDEAVVVAREDSGGDKRLIAYYRCAESGAAESGAEVLREHLSARLPEYMIPAAYVRLEAMPLTANGKLDRKALPAPEAEAYATRSYEAPVGERETMLAAIWAEVLKLERVGRHDNFFDLGGHSLLALRVIIRLQGELSLEVKISDLFARPVLVEFARGLEKAAPAALPAISVVERGGRIPLSFAQERLWFLAQMEGVSEAYHIALGVRLHGRLDARALRRALDRIVIRHEALRTSFRQNDGKPEQRIAGVGESGFLLQEEDLGQHADIEGELQRVMAEEAGAPFDLEAGPLIRGRLLRLAEEEHALLITMHHIVSDGWSMGILLKELNTLYGAFVRGEEDPLPELAVQYADYAVWQRERMEGEVLQGQVEYWKKT
jgi:hypothetical protein